MSSELDKIVGYVPTESDHLIVDHAWPWGWGEVNLERCKGSGKSLIEHMKNSLGYIFNNEAEVEESYGTSASLATSVLLKAARDAGVGVSVIPQADTPSELASYLGEKASPVKRPKAGDIFFVKDAKGGGIYHCGVVETVDKDHVVTIEGGVRNQDTYDTYATTVMLRREITSFLEFYRPKYKDKTLPKAIRRTAWDGESYPGDSAFRPGVRHDAVKALCEYLIAAGYTKHFKSGVLKPSDIIDTLVWGNLEDFREANGFSSQLPVVVEEVWEALKQRSEEAKAHPEPKSAKRMVTSKADGGDVVSLSQARAAGKSDRFRRVGGTTPGATEHVLRIEEALKTAGLLDQSVTEHGRFGVGLVKAYRQWQKSLDYTDREASGVPDRYSLHKLGETHGNFVVDIG